MEHLIIDVVIGLLLIYIAASFLLMKVQESVHGGFYRGRVSNMLATMDEAVGRDSNLKDQILQNSLVSSLWSGAEDARMGGMFKRAAGPSQIPGDLFAKALLMSLNPSGNLPSTEGRTPLAFIDSLMKGAAAGSNRYRYLQALRGLIPSNTSGWPEYEMAIATWFSDIGDRAEGWFKRRSEVVGLWLALALCLAINIDTSHIINALGNDTEVRQGFGALGELVVQQNNGAAAAKAPSIDPALDPAVRSVARLRDAQRYVVEAFRKDPAIAGYGAYESDTSHACAPGRNLEEAVEAARQASASGAGTATVNREIKTTTKGETLVKEAREFKASVPVPAASKAGRYADGRYLSNSDTWVLVLTRLQPALQSAVQRVNPQGNNEQTLREVYACLSHVGAWVNSAIVVSNKPDVRTTMLEAAKAIEDSASSVLAVIRNAEVFGGLRNLYRIDPEAFERCVKMPPQGIAAVSNCVLKEQNLMNRLPIGHGGANWRQQFCKVWTLNANAPEAEKEAFKASPSWPCAYTALPEQPQLGLQPMRLTLDPSALWAVLGGYLVSALFISLGAPVLFGFLNKFVALKNAGRVRDATSSGVQGAGTLPLPMLAMQETLAAAGGAGAQKVATLPLVEGSQPGFEESLTEREIQAVKQRLGVQPSTGGFDAATRAALLKEIGSEKLTLASYTQLMGRAPVQAGHATGALPTTRPQLRQPYALAQTLADNLNSKTGFPGRVIATTVSTFTDEMRAMAVLYRYRKQGNATNANPVFQTVIDHPEQLDQIDESLLNEILGTAVPASGRFPDAPWMDIALGELGQVESNGSTRSTSNPRVCEFLDAVGLGHQGDTTPWCGAFVAWVLKHPRAMPPAAPANSPATAGFQADPATGLLLPTAPPQTAASWKGWQRPTPSAAAVQPAAVGMNGAPPPAVGDVVVVEVEPGRFHTGFVFEVSTGGNEFWLLGGNQRGGSRVSLASFALKAIRV